MFFSNNKHLEAKISEQQAHIEKLTLELESHRHNSENEKEHFAAKLHELESTNHQLQSKLQESNTLLHAELNKSCESGFEDLDALFGLENHSLKTALLDIQGNIASSTEESKGTITEVGKVLDVYKTSLTNLVAINTLLGDVNNKSQTIDAIIKDLELKAKEIGKALGMIKEVVLQINILSLNASVEAASAGDAGKGFAVVAGEVKNLANKTSEVAKEIENVVKGIQENVAVTNEEFGIINTKISEADERVRIYGKELENVYHETTNSFSGIKNITDNIFMSLAKIDHVIWKVNTYLSVAEGKPAFTFVDHHNCRLGKWYEQGDGAKYFSTAPSYRQLERPHGVVHNGTHKVFELINENKKLVDYAALKTAFETMENGSKEVFTLLDKILKEAH